MKIEGKIITYRETTEDTADYLIFIGPNVNNAAL